MNYLFELIELLEQAERTGNTEDDPEGTRYIQLSDTLAREIAENLRKLVHEERTLKRYLTPQRLFLPTEKAKAKIRELGIVLENTCTDEESFLSELSEELYDIVEIFVMLDESGGWEAFQKDYPRVYELLDALDLEEKNGEDDCEEESAESTELKYLSEEKIERIKSIIQEIAESQK